MDTNLALWQEILAIVQQPGGWILALFAVLLYLLGVYLLVDRLGRRIARWLKPSVRTFPTVDDLAIHRAMKAINREPLRQWSDPASKGFRSGFISDHTASVIPMAERRLK